MTAEKPIGVGARTMPRRPRLHVTGTSALAFGRIGRHHLAAWVDLESWEPPTVRRGRASVVAQLGPIGCRVARRI